MQPPWSTATSTITAPSFIRSTIARVTRRGARTPATRTAPMSRSARSSACSMLNAFEASVTTRPWNMLVDVRADGRG